MTAPVDAAAIVSIVDNAVREAFSTGYMLALTNVSETLSLLGAQGYEESIRVQREVGAKLAAQWATEKARGIAS